MTKDVFSMLMATIGFIAVIVLTFYASKWYAGRMGAKGRGKHIKIIDRLAVGRNSSIVIIDVEGAQYLVGIGDHTIEMLKELEEPVKTVGMEMAENTINFKSFKAYLNKGREND